MRLLVLIMHLFQLLDFLAQLLDCFLQGIKFVIRHCCRASCQGDPKGTSGSQ
jgi:hypothetical protein